jgi:hypothetical protein
MYYLYSTCTIATASALLEQLLLQTSLQPDGSCISNFTVSFAFHCLLLYFMLGFTAEAQQQLALLFSLLPPPMQPLTAISKLSGEQQHFILIYAQQITVTTIDVSTALVCSMQHSTCTCLLFI